MEEGKTVLDASGVRDIDNGDTVIVADMAKRHIKGRRVYEALVANLGREG